MSTTAVKVERLSHAFGHGALQRFVVRDAELTLNSGEMVLLTGRSGSGKTTILNLLGGLRTVQAGSAQVLGVELNGATQQRLSEVRRNIRFIFQGNNLLRCLTAFENVSMALEVDSRLKRNDVRARSLAALDSVGLADCKDRLPASLSMGQQQRVAIARALVSRPQLLLADEPTAALDRENSLSVAELARRLARQHACTILLATHDERIYSFADRRYTIDDGAITRQ